MVLASAVCRCLFKLLLLPRLSFRTSLLSVGIEPLCCQRLTLIVFCLTTRASVCSTLGRRPLWASFMLFPHFFSHLGSALYSLQSLSLRISLGINCPTY